MEEIIFEREHVLVRRAVLEPGESLPWHTDLCERVTVVISGDKLAIEFRDNGEIQEVDVRAGQVDWDIPETRIHRGINIGKHRYEEAVTFFLTERGQVPQPRYD